MKSEAELSPSSWVLIITQKVFMTHFLRRSTGSLGMKNCGAKIEDVKHLTPLTLMAVRASLWQLGKRVILLNLLYRSPADGLSCSLVEKRQHRTLVSTDALQSCVMVVPCLSSSRGMLHSFSYRATLINAVGTSGYVEEFKVLNNSRSASCRIFCFPWILGQTLGLDIHADITRALERDFRFCSSVTVWPLRVSVCVSVCVGCGRRLHPLSGSTQSRRSVCCNEIIIVCYPVRFALWFSAKRN